MFESLLRLVQSNPQVAGALTLVIGSMVGYLARDIPRRLWGLILSQTTSEIEIDNSDYWKDDTNFTRFRTWYIDNGLLWMSRRFVLESNGSISAGGGNQYFLYKGRLFWFATEHLDSSGVSFRKQVLRIRGLTRSQDLLKEMVKVATHVPDSVKTTINIYKFKQHGNWDVRWEKVSSFPILRDSVPLVNENTYTVIQNTLQRFSNDREWFTENTVPYKRCFMFSGPPGTGKSTLAVKIAMQTARDVYIADVSIHGSEVFEHLVASVPPQSILLMEDVHSATALLKPIITPEDPDGRIHAYAGASLTSVLNVLSGAVPLDDVIIIMTTNYKELLEPALYRPGRVDVDLMIGYLDTPTIRSWLVRTFGDVARQHCYHTFPDNITTGEIYRLYELHRNDVSSIVAGLLVNTAEDRQDVRIDKEEPRHIAAYSVEDDFAPTPIIHSVASARSVG